MGLELMGNYADSTDSMDEMLDTDSPRECECVRACECVRTCEAMGVLGRVRGVPALLLDCLASSPLSAPAPALADDPVEVRSWEVLPVPVPRWSGCLGRRPLGLRLRCESCGFFGLSGT